MKFKLDDVDHKILDLLIDNSRIPFTDIAKKLLISSKSILDFFVIIAPMGKPPPRAFPSNKIS